ncbi:MAG: FAD-binding oxidoreductase [Rhizobiales bacterium]|nr:FAD-binding oxidoreductase [Hyphomicrobiales bacterium]
MDIDALKQTVRGAVTTRGDAGYEGTRAGLLWNGRKPERYPEIVVKAMDAGDVQAAVRFAARNGLRVSARGGGHNFSCVSLQDGLVVDLGAMDRLGIDVEKRTATAGPGVTNSRLAAALTEHGLAFPVGHCASVPVSGYLLGGGFGWNSGAWGIACHNVASVEVVLADGSLITASETENPEIFWAARGAGPEFFGIVTEYRLRLQDLPRTIRTSVWSYSLDRIDAVERWMSATMRILPSNVEFTAVMSSAPPPLADRAAKTVAAVATIFAASEEEAAATLAKIQSGAPEGALAAQLGMETPFDVLYRIIGQFFPEGRRYAADTHWSADPAALLRGLADSVSAAPSPETFALAVVLPPTASQAIPDTAFSMIGPAFGAAYAIWRDSKNDAENFTWVRQASERAASYSLGHYIGEADLDLPERARGSFSAAAYARLCSLQRKYDPAGLFHRPAREPLKKAG